MKRFILVFSSQMFFVVSVLSWLACDGRRIRRQENGPVSERRSVARPVRWMRAPVGLVIERFDQRLGKVQCDSTGLYSNAGRALLATDATTPGLCEAVWSSEGVDVTPDLARAIFADRFAAGAITVLSLHTTQRHVLDQECLPREGAPRWSADGRVVAYAKGCPAPELSRGIVATGESDVLISNLVSGEGVADFPSWSPDGHSIVYCRILRGRHQIERIDLRSGHQQKLVDGCFPAWSPDGQWIAYLVGNESSTAKSLCLIAPVGGTSRVLFVFPKAGGRDVPTPFRQRLVWNQEGRRIAARFGARIAVIDMEGVVSSPDSAAP